MFIILGNRRVNADHVREYSVIDRGEEKTVDVTFNDGTSKSYDVHANFDEEVFNSTIVPAPEGYARVTYWPPDDLEDKGSVWTDPIIAFQVNQHYLRPVLLDGLADDDSSTAILCPDGKVDVVLDRTFDSIDAFFEHKEKEAKDHLAKQLGQ